MIGMGKIEDDVKPGNTFNRQRVRSGLVLTSLKVTMAGKFVAGVGKRGTDGSHRKARENPIDDEDCRGLYAAV